MSNFPCSLSRNITSHSMENLAFRSLLRWKMIILPILASSLVQFLFKKVWRMYFLSLGVKGLTISDPSSHWIGCSIPWGLLCCSRAKNNHDQEQLLAKMLALSLDIPSTVLALIQKWRFHQISMGKNHTTKYTHLTSSTNLHFHQTISRGFWIVPLHQRPPGTHPETQIISCMNRGGMAAVNKAFRNSSGKVRQNNMITNKDISQTSKSDSTCCTFSTKRIQFPETIEFSNKSLFFTAALFAVQNIVLL